MKIFIKHVLPVMLLVIVLAGCSKTEFMPPPEGEKIPYNTSADKDISTLLQQSPYKMFYAAWQRSTIGTIQNQTKKQYTVLVPTDAALQGAGYTADAIQAMPVNEVDSLVAYYTLRSVVTKNELLARNSSFMGVSLQVRTGLRVAYFYGDGTGQTNYDPYYYRHYISISDGKLLVNGVLSGDAALAMEATNGYIWPVDRVIPRAEKSFLQVLEADPRFTMLLELQRRADELHQANYARVYEENVGFPSSDYRRRDYFADLAIPASRNPTIRPTTIFAPTNDAFKAAGFNTVDEMMEWNKRGGPMVFDWDTWEVNGGGFPTDTILAYHWDFGRENLPYGSWGKAPDPNSTIFYTNDLTNALLENYMINNMPGYIRYVMPFSFGTNSSGQAQVQVKGSTQPAATVTETINTLTGPLHVVDRLLIPKDFKMK